jgi:integrase
MLLLLAIGPRSDETCGIRHEDRQDDGLFILRQGSKSTLKTAQSKAWVPLSTELQALIGPPRKGYILATANGTPMSPNNLLRMVKSVASCTSVGEITTQELRHNAVVSLLQAGVDPRTVSEITRHSLEMCMRIYARVTQDHKRQAMKKLEKWRESG